MKSQKEESFESNAFEDVFETEEQRQNHIRQRKMTESIATIPRELQFGAQELNESVNGSKIPQEAFIKKRNKSPVFESDSDKKSNSKKSKVSGSKW